MTCQEFLGAVYDFTPNETTRALRAAMLTHFGGCLRCQLLVRLQAMMAPPPTEEERRQTEEGRRLYFEDALADDPEARVR